MLIYAEVQQFVCKDTNSLLIVYSQTGDFAEHIVEYSENGFRRVRKAVDFVKEKQKLVKIPC